MLACYYRETEPIISFCGIKNLDMEDKCKYEIKTVWRTMSLSIATSPPGTFRESGTEIAGRGKMVFRKLKNSAAEFSPEGVFPWSS